MDCLLCRIVAGTEEASVVYQDNRVLALCNLYPVNPGHPLVIPKRHAVDLVGLDEEDGRQVLSLGQRLARAIRHTDLRCEGINLFLADGEVAGQEIFHAHLHVIPRYAGDRFRLSSGQSSVPTARADLDAVADTVRAALNS
jgi:diadenosine tetraphosphate (Ap4A) HIT family hydrolase